MRNGPWPGLDLGIVGALILLAGCQSPAPHAPLPAPASVRSVAQDAAGSIRRFGRVPDPLHPERRIYRGGQPSDAELRGLSTLGVTRIVSFQNVYDQGEETADVLHEREMAVQLGMTFINLPIDTEGMPTEETVTRFLEAARDSERHPLFVHCELGRDRTGAMIAIYRLYEDRYTAEQALAEMESFGFDRASFPAVVEFVRDHAGRAGARATAGNAT